MGSQHRFLRLALLGIVTALGSLSLTESVSAQYGSWRGRTMTRNGLFRVTKTRWGNGITPTGASVLIPLIENAPAIINAATGRGSASQSRAPSREPWAGWNAYAAEQKRATDLLAKLAKMSGGNVAIEAKVEPGSVFPKLKPTDYGPDPWEALEVDQ